MNNLITFIFAILISFSFLTSCTSKSGQRVRAQERLQDQTFEEITPQKEIVPQKKDVVKKPLTKMDSIFEKTSKDIDAFVSQYDNWNDSYYWKSEKTSDSTFDLIRLCGAKQLPDNFIIEKRSSKPGSRDVVGYTVNREEEDGKTVYTVETSLFSNNEEVESQREVFILSTPEELITALKPFYKRLEQAKRDVKKNISRIEQMADKS